MESNVNKALYGVIRIASTILIVLLVVYGTMRAGMIAYDFGYRVFTEPAVESKPGTNVVVTIEKNMGDMDIAEYLESEGLIRDAKLFWLQYQLSAYKGEIVSGTYTLNTSMTGKEMMVVMSGAEEENTEESTEENNDATETTDGTESTE